MLCGAYVGDVFISGLFNGDILKWSGTRIGKNIEAHTKSCTSLYVRKSTPGFISGGKDGKVIIWAQSFTKSKVIDLHDPAVNSYIPECRSVCENDSGSMILVGT